MNIPGKNNLRELGLLYQYGTSGIKSDKEKAISIYKEAIKAKDWESYIYLGNLYNEVQDTRKAIHAYNKAIEHGYFQCFTNLGDIYNFGGKDVNVNLELAVQYYRASVKYGPNKDVKDEGQHKLTILIKNKGQQPPPEPEESSSLDIINHLPVLEHILKGNLEQDSKMHKENPMLEQMKNDHQNVHNHTVCNTVVLSVENLQKKTTLLHDKVQTLRQVISFLEEKKEALEKATYHNAKRALKEIENSSTLYRDLEMTEWDILHLVWNRIHDPINRDNIANLKDNLLHQLSDCMDSEMDKYICPMGAFTRILDSLNYCDKENLVQIVPKYVFDREMMAKASVISCQLFEKQLPRMQRVLQKQGALSPEERELLELYNKSVKRAILKQLETDYVKSDIFSREVFYQTVNKWIDCI